MLYDLSKHYTIRELCQEKRLSETIFKECFKAIYQQTPYNFLRMAKMNKAAELLRGKKLQSLRLPGNWDMKILVILQEHLKRCLECCQKPIKKITKMSIKD